MKPLDDILSGGGEAMAASEPTNETEPTATEPVETSTAEQRARDEKGRFARKESDPASTEGAAEPGGDPQAQAPEPQNKGVPPAALVAERNKAKEEKARADALERQVQQLSAQMQAFMAGAQPKPPQAEPAPVPEIWDDPNSFVQHNIRQALDPVREQLMFNARLVAASVHGKDTVEQAVQAFDAAISSRAIDPVEYQRIMASPNPFHEAVAWHKRQSVLSEIGEDPDAYKARLAEEIRAQVLAELQGQQPQTGQQPSPGLPATMPSNLANARSASPRSGPAWSGPAPLNDIFSRGRRK